MNSQKQYNTQSKYKPHKSRISYSPLKSGDIIVTSNTPWLKGKGLAGRVGLVVSINHSITSNDSSNGNGPYSILIGKKIIALRTYEFTRA
jgi:hypothetical protein